MSSALVEEPPEWTARHDQLVRDNPDAFRIVGELKGADHIMRQTLFLGTYPGLTPAMLAYELEVIHEFVRSR